MKIAQLGARSIPAQHGGLEVVVEGLALGLIELGHEVTVFVGESGAELAGIQIELSRSVRGKYTHTASQLINDLWKLRRADFDVVHIHGVGPAFILLLAPFFGFRSVAVVTAHGIDWERKKWPRAAAAIFRTVSRSAIKRAAAVSAVSRSTAVELGREIDQDVAVIENGISIPGLPEKAPLDLPARYVVCMSRLTPEKNVERILDAYTDEVESHLGPLVVVGSGVGSYAGDYEASLRARSSSRVIWVGSLPRPDALAVVRDASAYISMSKLEAQPMAVLEALALGVPLVLSDIAAHREIGGDRAVYADPDSSDVLERALLNLSATASGPSRTGSLPPIRDWGEVAARYEAWYRQTLGLANESTARAASRAD
ncbi:glycosyltransferase family 4 protein [Microbacterium sp. P5_E9]